MAKSQGGRFNVVVLQCEDYGRSWQANVGFVNYAGAGKDYVNAVNEWMIKLQDTVFPRMTAGLTKQQKYEMVLDYPNPACWAMGRDWRKDVVDYNKLSLFLQPISYMKIIGKKQTGRRNDLPQYRSEDAMDDPRWAHEKVVKPKKEKKKDDE